MTESRNLRRETLPLNIDGVQLSLSVMRRDGSGPVILFLHGFGSTKEDYADVACHPGLANHAIIAYDAPGCGETECSDLSALSISFLRRCAEAVLAHYAVDDFHLVGHSMGGLTALKLAAGNGRKVLSFTNIEGNVAPEDCFLSRQILEHPADDPMAFLEAFIQRLWENPSISEPLFAASLRHKVRAEAAAPIFRSLVQHSDQDPLLETFVSLDCAKMFVYGECNRSLSYLGTLMRQGVQMAEIECSGHWPMYANPMSLWGRLAAFIAQVEKTPKAI